MQDSTQQGTPNAAASAALGWCQLTLKITDPDGKSRIVQVQGRVTDPQLSMDSNAASPT